MLVVVGGGYVIDSFTHSVIVCLFVCLFVSLFVRSFGCLLLFVVVLGGGCSCVVCCCRRCCWWRWWLWWLCVAVVVVVCWWWWLVVVGDCWCGSFLSYKFSLFAVVAVIYSVLLLSTNSKMEKTNRN